MKRLEQIPTILFEDNMHVYTNMEIEEGISLSKTTKKYTQDELEKNPHFCHPNWKECSEEFGWKDHSGEEYEFEATASPSDPSSVLITKVDVENTQKIQIVESVDGKGIKCMESKHVPIFIVCPKKILDGNAGNGWKEMMFHLEKLLAGNTKQVSRVQRKNNNWFL